MKKRKLPRNIRFTVAFLADLNKVITDMFARIFYDYLDRFSLEPPTERILITVSGTEGAKEASPTQLAVTICSADGKNILVDIRDPSLDGDDADHIYIHYLFVETLAHELVHVMQMITDKKNYPPVAIKFNPEDTTELYYFTPEEIEARTLAPLYGSRYGSGLLEACENIESE